MSGRRIVGALALIAVLQAGCQSSSQNSNTNATANAAAEANKAATRHFMEAGIAGGDSTMVDSLIAMNFVEHQTFPGLPPDRNGLKMFIVQWHAAFPDLKIEVHDMIADSNEVWVHSTMSGTMTGPLMGMKPTGKSFQSEVFDLVRIEDGKAVEHWGAQDTGAMMMQLGLAPAAPGGKSAKR